MGRQQEPTAHSALPPIPALLGQRAASAQNPRLAAQRSENSRAPGDKDKPPGCERGQEKARKIWQLFLPGKGKWSPSNIHRTQQSCSSDSKFGKGRMKGRGVPAEVFFPFPSFGESREGGGAERYQVNNIIVAMCHVIIAIQGPIIHIEQASHLHA